MVKKIGALFVSAIFAFSVNSAFAQEEKILNPWESDQETTSLTKEEKAKNKAKRKEKKKKRKKAKKAKKTSNQKAKQERRMNQEGERM